MAIAKSKTKLQPYWYTMESEREQENPTRWYIQPLKPAQRELLTTFDSHRNLGFHMHSYNQALLFSLIDWQNFNDEDGDPVIFSKENFELMDEVDRTYLALEIYNGSYLKEQERKNLPSQSQ